MRILHLAYSFYETDTRMLRYVETLLQEGHEVEVLALRRKGARREEIWNGASLTRLQRRQVNEAGALTYLLKLVAFTLRSSTVIARRHRRRPYNLIHVHNVPDFLVFAGWLPRRTGTKLILDIHDILPELYIEKFGAAADGWVASVLRWIERKSARFADHVIVANELWREKLIERAVPPSRCTTLMNYPDTRLFHPKVEQRQRKAGGFMILYPGTLNRHQGVDIAVRAFASALTQMPGAEFHIYGEGPAAGELRELVDKLGVNDSVQLHDRVLPTEVARVMAEADLGVIPKLAVGFGDEAFSTKSLEFMACGVPVLMSRTTIDSRYFNEDLVRFFPSGDVDALAEALVSEYRGREAARVRATRALEFARRESWQYRQQIYLDLVSRLANLPV